MTCELCTARAHVYDTACLRCVARDLARVPRRFSGEMLQHWCEGKPQRAITDVRNLRDEERALEVKQRFDQVKAGIAQARAALA